MEQAGPCQYIAWETQPSCACVAVSGAGVAAAAARTARSERAAKLPRTIAPIASAGTACPSRKAATHSPDIPRTALVWGVSELTRHMVRGLLRARGGWSFTRDPRHSDVVLQWAPLAEIMWDRVLKGEIMANHAVARSGLVRKADLARNLEGTRFLPETHTSFSILHAVCPQDRFAVALAFLEGLLAADAQSEQSVGRAWVLKPSESSNGNKVHPFCSPLSLTAKNVLRQLLETDRPWLVQRYVDRPLLLHGRKTHCRAYILVVGPNSPSSVYIHKWVPVFVSSVAWTMENLEEPYAHLTNRSVQQAHPKFTAEGHGTSLDALAAHLSSGQKGTDVGCEALRSMMFSKLAGVVHGTFRALAGRGPKQFFSTPQCFELFGMDAMFDDDLHCWLLEVNSMPALEVLDEDTREALLDDILRLGVDPQFPPRNLPPPEAAECPNGFVLAAEAANA